jgi:integrase
MPQVALTDRFCERIKPLKTQTDYFDSNMKGLALRVSEGGRKAWSFLFTSPKYGKRARITLGAYPATSLAVARARALEAKGHVEAGNDPRDVFAAQDASAMTMANLIDSYMEKHVRPNLKSAKHMEERLSANVTPAIGSIKLADLHRRDINRAIDPIVGRNRPTQARLVYTDLRGMLNWAVARGDLDRNPMDGMTAPAQVAVRERALSDEEIKTLWNGLPTSLPKSKACQHIIKLCLVTAQRVGEVAGMRREELDLKPPTWSLPGSRTKNGHPHLVPLSDLALNILEEAIADVGEKSEMVFLNDEGSGPLPAHAVARTIGRAQQAGEGRPMGRFGIAHWTAHDLRRTALTGMAKLGVPPIVLGHVANHRTTTKAGVTLGVYIQHGYQKEVRDALELWADRLDAIIAGANAKVVPISNLKRHA